MFKAFFLLWLVVFTPIFFLIMPHGYSPLPLVNNFALKSFFVQTYSGTFYLIEKRLQTIPPELWSDHIKQLSSEFGYELHLLPLHSATTDPTLQHQLQANEFAFSNGEPELLLHRVFDSQWVISMALDVTVSEAISQSSRGSVYLMIQEFNEVPNAQWPEVLSYLKSHFHFDLDIMIMSDLRLDPGKTKKLNQNQLVWIAQPDGKLIFYHQLPDQKSVLRARAIAVSSNAQWIYLVFGIIFVLMVSIGMFLWVYPLWRDLNRLTTTATDFGEGYLAQRAKLPKNSVIARLGLSFNIMADSIEKLISGHRELTNAIAHDLRTPLYRLRFAFDMLDDDDITKAEKQKYRRSINNSINDLDHLISQTLVLSRYSRAKDITHFTHCKLAETMTQEIAHFCQENPALSVEFKLETQLAHSLFLVDERAVIRAFNNLLSNASRYANTKIKVSLCKEHQDYILTVEDDGPGIEKVQWEKIFQPFVQLENQQRDTSCGHGLGLAIVQQIAHWHKGQVTIAQSNLKGAKFEIRWPSNLK